MGLHTYDLDQDTCSAAGSARLKAAIEAYWAQRGAAVTVTIAETRFQPSLRSTGMELRSDMINGWPRVFAEGRDPADPVRRPSAPRRQNRSAVQP